MTRLHAQLCAFLCCVFMFAMGHAATPNLEHFDQHFRAVLAEPSVPGGAYTVVGAGRVLRTGTYGVRRVGHAEPVDVNTVFRLASVSKTFAGPLALQLVDEQRLELTASLATLAADFPMDRALMRTLRVEDLLGQSTGLVANAYDNLLDDGLTLAAILPRFKTLKPICTPRSCYSYQNIAFAQIGPILSTAGGLPYEELIAERFFRPLAMRHASFGRVALQNLANFARPHQRKHGIWKVAELMMRTTNSPQQQASMPASAI